MKHIIQFSIVTVFLLLFSSCDKNLEDLNKNKVNPTTLEPSLLLNQAIVSSSFPFKTLVFDIGIVQQIISPNGGVLAGANFNQDSRDVTTQPIW
ncbi:MAG: SusD/RagB family nutrient-binding outer membrane lipoprotein, partial [Ferruginibacter sp.]